MRCKGLFSSVSLFTTGNIQTCLVDPCPSEEDEETAEEKCMRENPGVPVITNLEDLYKLPRLQKVQQEEQRKTKAAKLKALRKRLEAEEGANATTSSPVSIVDLD